MNKLVLIAILAVAIGMFFLFGGQQYLSLDHFNSVKSSLFAYQQANPLRSSAIFLVVYILVTGLSLPGAAIMTLAGGAIFGFWHGLLLVSFASTIGASIAFLFSRNILRDWVQNRFGDRLGAINAGMDKDGPFYLFSIRLIPVFPFFLVNLLMGLTSISLAKFFLVSQIGMLPGTMVYVNAGKQLATLDSVGGVMSPALWLSFLLLALFPFLVKRFMSVWSRRRALAKFDKPKKVDANLLVIGAGSAGLVSSLIAANTNAKAILVERHKMGGDCLNTGCVPSKALLRSAKIKHYFTRADEFGLRLKAQPELDFASVMQRVQQAIRAIEPKDSVERYESLGVQCEAGEAKLISPYEVEVRNTDTGALKTLRANNIVLATGARPFVPPIPGLESVPYYTSDTIWSLRKLPASLLIMGAGPIGCELAQAFARLGSEVTLVDMADRILPREDFDAADELTPSLVKDGVKIMVGSRATRVELTSRGGKVLHLEQGGVELELPFKDLLIAVGRKPNSENLGLEELGVELNQNGTVRVDEYLRSNIPTIYACGDIAGPYQFTHTAAHQAWYASVNALFGALRKFKVDYSVIPWATFTDPEVARVGLNELEAREQGIAYELTRYTLDDLDRAIADGEDHGFIKVLTAPGSDKILGVTIVGYHASDLLTEFVVAMKHGLGLKKILRTIHIYPTLSEASRFAAGEWQQNNKPERVLRWARRFHDWQRGG